MQRSIVGGVNMKRNKPQFWRLVELDRQIREGKYPNCLTFSEKWEVTQKTVQRDIDYLKYSLEAPIEYDRIKKGYFYTDKSWFLPSLNMSEGDLLILLVASRAMEQYRGTPVAGKLEQIFNKIAELIPDRISVKPELVFSRFSFTSPPAKPIDEKIWVQIVRGLLTQRKVKMTYQAFESTAAKAWLFSPYHMANLQGEWYAFGTTESGDMVVQFSLARIISANITDIPFTIPDGFDSKTLLAGAFGRFTSGGQPKTIRLLFNKEIAAWVLERQWNAQQKVVRRKNGEIELSFPAAGLFEVFRWVLAWGHHVQVLEPQELKKMISDEINLMKGRTGK